MTEVDKGEGERRSSANLPVAHGEHPGGVFAPSASASTLGDAPVVGAYGDFPREAPLPENASTPKPPFVRTFWDWLRDYFLGDDPTFGIALVPYCLLAIVLFSRGPKTNFIFDEQEALLANPYVRSVGEAAPKFHWIDAFSRDFWGLGPERSIGSYRPIPNLLWRALWAIGPRDQSPFLHHFVNLLLHGANGALVCVLTFALTKRRGASWIAGAAFTTSAVLTEAVSGVVGIADILGAMGALIALLALTYRLHWMVLGVLVGTLFGLYSKESALCCVPLLPLGALLLYAPQTPGKDYDGWARWGRAVLVFVVAAGAFVFYVTARRKMFPAPLPQELLREVPYEGNRYKWLAGRAFAALLRWYAQPVLPKDPLNNPLVGADAIHRIGGALRVWFRGLTQLVFPLTLSGDYSAPQEPVPETLWTPEIILGAIAMVLPFPLAATLFVRARSRRPLAGSPNVPPKSLVMAFGALWIVLSFFPVSNIPVLLPTIRAERFWYFPAVMSSVMVGVLFAWLVDKVRASELAGDGPLGRQLLIGGFVLFFGFQCIAARKHALDYNDDLAFWDATRKAVPRSAKAHLNYSVMKGARGDLKARLDANAKALELAPKWPMASIYYADTLCRLHRAEEAWPHYKQGFELNAQDVNLIALGVQCLWDEKMLEPDSNVRAELDALKDKYPGSWLEYIARDVLEHGEEHNGVDPKYRPRGYNEGPKD